MKKVLFLQNIGNSYGGVWFVNKTIGEELINNDYDVEILSIRDSHKKELEHDEKLKVSIVNKNDLWEITHFEDIKKEFIKFKIIKSIKLLLKKIKEEYKLKKDYNYVKSYIRKNNYDYIVTTHYQLLDCIPKEYLKKTIHEQHTSFITSYNHLATRKTFDKYNGKVTFLWLSKKSSELAKGKGYLNSTYIYNPIKFTCLKKADVINNKKLVTISRFSEEKRLDLMVKIVDEVLKNNKFKNWIFEIYGDGPLKKELMNLKYDAKKIKIMGFTNDTKSVLMKSSINLNTSLFEGFSMGILEASECGVPTITFDFGESVSEEIQDNVTGLIVNQEDLENYKKKLELLMSDSKLLETMSKNCKNFAKQFNIKIVIKEWIRLFNRL